METGGLGVDTFAFVVNDTDDNGVPNYDVNDFTVTDLEAGETLKFDDLSGFVENRLGKCVHDHR